MGQRRPLGGEQHNVLGDIQGRRQGWLSVKKQGHNTEQQGFLFFVGQNKHLDFLFLFL